MKPDDESGKLPTSERPFRIFIISGSGRRAFRPASRSPFQTFRRRLNNPPRRRASRR
jgi:hypothetical protein